MKKDICQTLYTYTSTSRAETHRFFHTHAAAFLHEADATGKQNGVICLLLSVMLTRGERGLFEDMDEPDATLMGRHAYCTQVRTCCVVQNRLGNGVMYRHERHVRIGNGQFTRDWQGDVQPL